MKKLIIVFLFLASCYTDDTIYDSRSCSGYSDLCGGYPSGIHYELCSDDYGTWWEVNGREYYTVDYMLSQECNF